MKKLCALLCIVFVFGFQTLFSQKKVIYGYDFAGNRISKVITLKSNVPQQEAEDEVSPFFDELSEREIKIYPNPTRGNLIVEISNISDIKKGKILIHSLSGTLVLSQDITTKNINLNLTTYASGTYIMSILIDEEQTSWKIIKE